MSLKDEVNAALIELSKAPNLPDLALDSSGFCRFHVPIPPVLIKLHKGELGIDVQISPTGKFFSLTTPLAVIQEAPPSAFYEALLQRQFYAEQVAGASFAISVTDDYDQVMALYHWPLDSITTDAFKRLYQRFMAAAFDLIDEINEMALKTPQVIPLHEGRS